MELPLRRNDIAQVSPAPQHPTLPLQVGSTSLGSFAILSSSKPGRPQKVVVGDASGEVTCVQCKHGEASTVFRVPVSKRPIASLSLGGHFLPGTQDRFFVSSGPRVVGLSKKGREFFSLDTGRTEEATSLSVEGSRLFLAGDYTFNHFLNGKDHAYYMASDHIHALSTVPTTGGEDGYAPVLACHDRCLRVLQGEKVAFEVDVAGIPLSLAPYGCQPCSTHAASPLNKDMAVGMLEGSVSLFRVDEKPGERRRWMIGGGGRGTAVQAIACKDLTSDGVCDVIVGRENGSLEVYCLDVSSRPSLKFKTQLGESITGIDVGTVSSSGSQEVVASTYSGKVVGFYAETTDGSVHRTESEDAQKEKKSLLTIMAHGAVHAVLPSSTAPTMASDDRPPPPSKQMKGIQDEVAQLEEKLEKEKEKFTKLSKEMIATAVQYSVNDSLRINPMESCHDLSIELSAPMDMILLQSNTPIAFLGAESPGAVVSNMDCGPTGDEDGNLLLVTVRFAEPLNRIALRLRLSEGHAGVLSAFVVPRMVPRTCLERRYNLKPLSVHRRLKRPMDDRLLNTLTLTGAYTLAEMHAWIGLCVDEIPEKTPVDDVITYHFISTYVGTVLTCSYRRGEAVFKSDSVSTLTVLKDSISKEATTRGRSLSISSNIEDGTIEAVLELLRPKLLAQEALSRQASFIDAVKELQVQEGDVSYLSPELRKVAEDATSILARMATRPDELRHLHDTYERLYLDYNSFKGVDARGRLPQLHALLEPKFQADKVVRFFGGRYL